MVWALRMPGGFGDYFPEADFVGWEDWTKSFSKTVESGTYAYLLADKFNCEIGAAISPNHPIISPIAEHEWPTWYETRKRYPTLGSLFEMSGRILAVEEALKDVIERIEPGIHLFHPIAMTTRKGDVYPKRYYTMVIGQFLDSFDPAKSTAGSWSKEKGYDSYMAFINAKESIEGLALSRSSFGSAHLWRERRLRSPEFFLSDTLHNEIIKAGLRIPRHYRMKEV
jgi:hypothetical protein